jgi:ribose transport system permease protein
MKTKALSKSLKFINTNKNSLIRYGCFLLVIIAFSIATSGKIFNVYNLKVMTSQTVYLLFCTVGLLFVFAHGSFDISAGAVVAVSSLVCIYMLNANLNVYFAILMTVVVSALFYVLNALIAQYMKIISVISSLAIMFIGRGIATIVVSNAGDTIRISDFSKIAIFQDYTFMVVSAVIFVIICFVLFDFTKFGYQTKAIGDNPIAANESGARVNLIKLLGYLIAGIGVGMASVFYFGRTGSVSDKTGLGLEMDIIIALILGGMTLTGGSKSRMSSAIFGTVTYVLLTHGLSMIPSLSSNLIPIIKGVIFLIIIVFTLRAPKSTEELPK